MNKKIKIILAVLFTLITSVSQAQNITVIFQPPPPLQFFTENLFKLTLVNPTQTTYRIYLHGKATESVLGLVADATTDVFTLPPGAHKTVTSALGKITLNDNVRKEYKDILSHTGQLPAGNFDICVEVINTADGSSIGSSCIQQEVLQLSQFELLTPEDGEVIGEIPKSDAINKFPPKKFASDSGTSVNLWPPRISVTEITNVSGEMIMPVNSNILFSWLTLSPVSAGQHVTYKVKIVEMIGRQSSYDAMQSNPLFYSQSNIFPTSYQYPVAARQFSPGKWYAWQIEAYVNGVKLMESEIWKFALNSDPTNPIVNLNRLHHLTKKMGDNLFYDNFNLPGALLKLKEPSASGLNDVKTGNNPLHFGLQSIAYGESSNRSGTGSDKAPQSGYWQITPMISLYGIPLASSFLFSTENSSTKQNINSFSLNIEPSIVKDIIQQRVENDGKQNLSGALKLLSYFDELGIGTNYPTYTTNTMTGVPVTGLNVAFNPKWLYLAFSGSKNQKPINNEAYRRDIYTARLGYGGIEKSHIHIIGMYGVDKDNSITVDSANVTLTPRKNYVVGIEGRMNFLKNKLSVEGEVDGSMMTRDSREPDIVNASIPSFVKNIFHPNWSSQYDYSYSFKTAFENVKSATNVSAGIKMIGPGYLTMGNPTLRGDKLEFEGKIDQKVDDRQITFKTSIKWYRDNLINNKLATTNTTSLNVSLGFNFRKYPYLNINYIPYFQSNNIVIDSGKVSNQTHLIVISSGYTFNTQMATLSNTLSYSFNKANTFKSLNDYSSQNLTFNESVIFKVPFMLSASISLLQTKLVTDYSRIISFDGNASYYIEEIWTNTFGASSGVEKQKNKKISFYFNTLIQLSKGFMLELKAEKDLYKDWFNGSNDYDDFRLRSTLTTSF